jgi:metallo-beta-lactamase class B
MNQPVPPFRIIGEIYYVGAADVTAFLIRTSDGLILLDGGFVETAPQILANIRSLGFEPPSIRVLLNSHAHYDHAGGLAALKAATNAKLYAGRADSALLARGGRQDFFFKDRLPYPPVIVDRAVGDNDAVRVGNVTLRAVATPGHTRGCTTWATTVREAGREYAVLFICSLSIPGYRLRDDPPYPTIVSDYRESIAKLRRRPCDVFLAAHGSMFRLNEKTARLRAGDPLAFLDRQGCRAYVDEAAVALTQRLRQQ